MGVKSLARNDTQKAVERCANYYRKCRLYLSVYNSDDAYDEYIRDFTHDTEVMISQGYSCSFKGNYLIAVDIIRLKDEHPEEFHHYFDFVWQYLGPIVNREHSEVLFISAIGPSGNEFNSDTFKLVNEFVRIYNKHFVILTDCPVGYDFELFEKNTSSKLILIGGERYFRWGMK
jgi:hypothetical protein